MMTHLTDEGTRREGDRTHPKQPGGGGLPGADGLSSALQQCLESLRNSSQMLSLVLNIFVLSDRFLHLDHEF